MAVAAATKCAATPGAAAAQEEYGSGLGWKPCPAPSSALCATIRVPVDWERPGEGKLTLKVVKRPATDRAKRLGVLMTDWGGPNGTSGSLLQIGDEVYRMLTPQVRASFDVVAIDGREGHVRCDNALKTRSERLEPAEPVEFQRMEQDKQRYVRSCERDSPPSLTSHIDSPSIARDWDAVRKALGQKQITFHGVSYGTVTGQAYARLFPARVRAMVYDSVMYHNLSAREYLDSAAAGTEDILRGFADWCVSHPSGDQSCDPLLKKVSKPATRQAILDHLALLAHAASRGELVTGEGGDKQRVTIDALLESLTTMYFYKDFPIFRQLAVELAERRIEPESAGDPEAGPAASAPDPQFVLR